MTVLNAPLLLVADGREAAYCCFRAFKASRIEGELLWFSNGRAAYDYLFRPGCPGAERAAMPRLVLLYLPTRPTEGIELLRAVRACGRTRHVPVVVVAGTLYELDLHGRYRLGANSCVSKALDVAKMMEVVHYWLEVNRAPV